MSAASWWRRRCLAGTDAGFTLIEVMVALVLLALAGAALLPLLISGSRAALLARQMTTAKNLTTARINTMMALPYHIAAQNGPFLDLLDDYYTNASTTPTSITATGGTGVFVPSGTVPGQTASTAYYQVTFAAPSEPTGFSQVVDTQFLVPNSSPRQVLTPPSTYNNLTVNTDTPVSLLVGVTVVTSFTLGALSQSYRTYTELTDTGHDSPLVVAQSGATALSLSSSADVYSATSGSYVNSALTGTVGQVGIDASLATESSAFAQGLGASFTQNPSDGSTGSSATGAQASATSPPDPAGSTGQTSAGQLQTDSNESPCGWGAFGPTTVSDVSTTVANAQPRAPEDVESGSPQPTVQAGLMATSGGACSGVSFTNLLASSPAVPTNPAMELQPGVPLVVVPNTTGAGTVLGAAGNVDTPALTFTTSGGTSGHAPVTATATTSASQVLQLFPGMGFVSASTAGGLPSGNALVVVDLTNVSLSCASNSADATGSYSGTLYVWEQPQPGGEAGYVSYPLTYSSGSTGTPPPPPPLPVISSIPVGYTSQGVAVPLSNWIASWQTGGLVQQQPTGGGSASVGLHTIPGAFSLVTQPTLMDPTTSDPQTTYAPSAINLTLGRVSCVTEDNR